MNGLSEDELAQRKRVGISYAKFTDEEGRKGTPIHPSA
jgi:hypothetical protein